MCVSAESVSGPLKLSMVSSGGPHPEHDHRPGPLLPADCGRKSAQPAETHRGRDQDRGGEPGAAAGDGSVSGSQEAGGSVRPGRSGEPTLPHLTIHC